MTRIDDANFEVVVEERFSFECNARPVFDEIKDDVQGQLEELEKQDRDDIDDIVRFLDHTLTDEDKLSILEFIKDDFDYESCNPEYEISIFDEDRIRKSINDWIEDNFEFRPDEL